MCNRANSWWFCEVWLRISNSPRPLPRCCPHTHTSMQIHKNTRDHKHEALVQAPTHPHIHPTSTLTCDGTYFRRISKLLALHSTSRGCQMTPITKFGIYEILNVFAVACMYEWIRMYSHTNTHAHTHTHTTHTSPYFSILCSNGSKERCEEREEDSKQEL